MTMRCALYRGALTIFENPWVCPWLLFPKFGIGFFPIDTKNVHTKFDLSSFAHSWDNRGTQKNWAVPGYTHALFSPNFLMGFCWDGPCEWTGQIWKPYGNWSIGYLKTSYITEMIDIPLWEFLGARLYILNWDAKEKGGIVSKRMPTLVTNGEWDWRNQGYLEDSCLNSACVPFLLPSQQHQSATLMPYNIT